jgi:hypothetical protein
MILHTLLPLDQVLEGFNEMEPVYEEMNVDGITMVVEPVSPRRAKIVRLISPDPMHYLNPAYAPGQMIEFGPV